ncbi:hypothetical protein TH61_14525 [Rufibacter sp. DG15C]|uniref:diacylglycerol/lipid kinase family protein n=1 Tax=Rufibacter sp. DG15C TaxID=1379909 RepID=UPI00078BA414|nr:diacylglycerol kinase family protein [Rufibacter sp. DG15C]AMM52157.1 hypothetical protein TH61_14525 [Rufibacter sp. DG15C]
MKKILFVVNPISGDIDKQDLEETLKGFCLNQKISAEFYKTTGEQDEEKLKEKINSFKPEAVVAVGGDGTVSLVAKQIINTKIALAIIPQGSGNGLSKDLDIPQTFEEALQVLVDNRVKAIDTLDVNGEVSIHICDMGFNALVVKRFCEGETRGPGAYAWIAMQEFMGYTTHRYIIKSKGQVLFEGEAFMVTVTNAKAFGSNAAINPNGIINDGCFEVCVMEPFPKTSSLGILYRLYTDSIDESVYTQRFSCQEVIIENLDDAQIQIDGEPIEPVKQLTIKVQPRTLNVLLPNPIEQESA